MVFLLSASALSAKSATSIVKVLGVIMANVLRLVVVELKLGFLPLLLLLKLEELNAKDLMVPPRNEIVTLRVAP